MTLGHTIGILVNKHSAEPYPEFAAKCKLKLILFTPEGIDWQMRTVSGLYLTKYGVHFKRMPLPKVIYNRLYPHDQQTISRLTSLSPPIHVLNRITQFDKWTIHKLLTATDLAAYLPQTYEYDMATLHDALIRHGDIVIKPRLGRQGSGLWRLTALPGNRLLIKPAVPVPIAVPYTDAIINLLHILMIPYTMVIQEYIHLAAVDGCHFDLRALVQKNRHGDWQVTALTSRIAQADQYITNYYQKVMAAEELLANHQFPVKAILDATETISIKTARILEQKLGHLAEISGDLCLDQANKLWIVEVNGKPDKLLYCEQKDPELVEQVYLTPLEYGLYLHKKRRPGRGVCRLVF